MWLHTIAVVGSEAILCLHQSFRLPEQSSIYLISTIYMARYTPLLHRCDWKKGSRRGSNTLCSPTFEHNTDRSPVSQSITYCEYVGPIFQSQLLNVGPEKSNDTRFSYNQGEFGNRIEQNNVCEDVDLAPQFI